MFSIVNRQDAGRLLAKELSGYKNNVVVIYALPRGGVVLGFEIAKELGLPLDVVITRKIGHPDNPEYAVCSVTEEGDLYCNEYEKSFLNSEWLKEEVEKEKKEAQRRKNVYLKGKEHISAKGKTAIIVDDGIATGLTMFAAIKYLKKEKPKKIVVAVPVAPHDTLEILKKEVNEVVVLEDAKRYLGSVGAYYRDFPQVSDQEVVKLLNSP